MTHNALLGHLKATFGLDEAAMAALFDLGGLPLSAEDVAARLRDFAPEHCSYSELVAFLDGFILSRRGPSPRPPPPAKPPRIRYPNNVVLKKLRIALAFKEDETAAAFASGGMPMDHYAIGALFRQEGQSQFRACTDEQLQAFLRGVGP